MKSGLLSAVLLALSLFAVDSLARPVGFKIQFIQAWLKKSRTAANDFGRDAQAMRNGLARAYANQADHLRNYHPAGTPRPSVDAVEMEPVIALIPLVNQSYTQAQEHIAGAGS